MVPPVTGVLPVFAMKRCHMSPEDYSQGKDLSTTPLTCSDVALSASLTLCKTPLASTALNHVHYVYIRRSARSLNPTDAFHLCSENLWSTAPICIYIVEPKPLLLCLVTKVQHWMYIDIEGCVSGIWWCVGVTGRARVHAPVASHYLTGCTALVVALYYPSYSDIYFAPLWVALCSSPSPLMNKKKLTSLFSPQQPFSHQPPIP